MLEGLPKAVVDCGVVELPNALPLPNVPPLVLAGVLGVFEDPHGDDFCPICDEAPKAGAGAAADPKVDDGAPNGDAAEAGAG